ncbi:hypothetical protein GOP47_0006058 [Adiantum capillus-veneris]|uniref:DUF819 domain-containing protein n=1 Tax=Adiantum capillus-veneris TaxID=13818 RepID=A0A9D4V3P5_ADICA|nr:hypothetical protein GOP47_0006058 [Adiantum capillus-veneris]
MAARPFLSNCSLPLCISSPNLLPHPRATLRCKHGVRRPRLCNGLLSIGLQLLPSSRAPQLTMALISPDSSNALFCLMASCAAFGQVMEAKTQWGSKLSAPLVALLFGMALAGAGVVPSMSSSYDFVSSSIMPMAVSLCLLETDVQSILGDAGVTLRAFWYGALGTIIGTVLSFKIVGHALGPDGWKIASSLCASYIGGTINYVATAQALGLTSSSTLAAGMAADNLAMAAYFALIMSIPDAKDKATLGRNDGVLSNNSTPPTVESISTSLAAAATACTLGRAFAGLLPSSFTGCGLAITALIASCFSIAAAQVYKNVPAHTPVFAGSQILGGGLMLLYFSVVGASAGLRDAFLGGWPLLVFIVLLISVHLGIILLLGRWSKLPIPVVLVASNANIGGPTTAAAMASCRGWNSLVKPALLVGTLGYIIGTGIGCLLGLHVLRRIL